jgi:choline-sulfatase
MARRRDAVALLLILGLLLAAASDSLRPGAVRPRNLLLITLDTMRADRLPVYGFAGVDTPALDRIAAEGTVFEEAFAAVPLTLPSHASLFTGIYPPRLGVRDNAGAPLSSEFTTMAELLRGQGLQTAAFVASAVLAPGRGMQQGFDVYTSGPPARCSGAPPTRRRAAEVVDETLSWLQHRDAEPFFAWIHLFDTHRPYDLPPEYKDRHFDPYLAAIAYEDSQIARLTTYLESRRLLENTLIVVVGDHGESLGDHGEESHGIFVYQEALRVPLIIRGPGVSVRRVTSIARLVDVMPTVLALFGMNVSGLDGTSLARHDEQSGRREGLEVYAESMYPLRFGWAPLRSLRADRYKLIDAPKAELYDLMNDPGEERNVLKEHPTVAAAMLRRLRSFDSEDNPATAPPQATDSEVSERIASLGYVGGALARTPLAGGDQVDPKDRIDVFNRITAQQWENTERARAMCR